MVLEGGVAGGELRTAVVSGQWSVVSGQWSVVSGQWLETSAALAGMFWRGALRGVSKWSVVSGQWWSVAVRRWREWFLEGGVAGGVELQWSVVSGQWVSGQWSVVSGWRQVRRWREWFWRGALRGVSNCSGQWSVVSGWRQVRRWREWFWRGALGGGTLWSWVVWSGDKCRWLQWSVVSGQWSVVSGQWSVAGDKCGAGGNGFGGGRCGGCPPAQGRAEGPTAHIGRQPLAAAGVCRRQP